jgi:hypothetical protein
MQAGFATYLAYAGAISVERTWRAKGVDVKEKKRYQSNDTENIKIALADGWVITFPQGTKSLSRSQGNSAYYKTQAYCCPNCYRWFSPFV